AASLALLKIGTYTNTGVTPANPTQFDSFSITPVAEPATVALLALGFAGMIPCLRRRKLQSALGMGMALLCFSSHAEEAKPAQKLPFYAFSDKMDHFIPS